MNRVTLYIAGQEVELADDSLILYNYSLEDMSNPTIVENSYSQSVTIQGTPNNNKIFGDIWRLDRQTIEASAYTGINFDPTRKTPFTIEDSTGAQIESGYVKLDSIKIDTNNIITYSVTLYGGLGSFLYGLQYNEDGDQLTLADLQYLDTQDPDGELTFNINKTNVAAAWSALDVVPLQITSKWQVINFAPAYNGIPSDNFNADKGLIIPSEHGLSDDYTETDEDTNLTTHWRPIGGYALMTMSEEHTEWECKDLRSYLQRPVFSIKAFLNALTKTSNTNGYIVNINAVKDLDYADTWMTLPLLPDLGTYKQETGSITATITSASGTTHSIANIALTGASSMESGTEVTSRFSLNLKMMCSASSATPLKFRQTKYMDSSKLTEIEAHLMVGFLQLLAYDSDDNLLAGSDIHVIGDLGLSANATQCARMRGYSPIYQDDTTVFCVPTEGQMVLTGTNEYTLYDADSNTAKELVFEVTATDVSYYTLNYQWFTYAILAGATETSTEVVHTNACLFDKYDRYASESGEITDLETSGTWIVRGATADVITYTTSESLRSNAVITKAMMLTTDNTPADYLLSLCKIFGWYLTYNQHTKTITIKTRNDLFSETIVDLTDRLITSKGITLKPYAIESKWYDFELESVGGLFADTYESTNGKTYGMKRLNTGYEFNSESKDLLDSVVFKSGVPSLETNKYNNVIVSSISGSAKYLPSVFLDTDNKYTMWTTDGESKDLDISQPKNSSTITWLNDRHGYDVDGAWKMQFHGEDNGSIDGDSVLLFYNGKKSYSHFKLTDDLSVMNQVNDGVPCWILGYDSTNPTLSVPIFSAYQTSGVNVTKSMDFGVPAELNLPNVEYKEAKTIYNIAWKSYLTDKYNKDTKVMTAYIDFRGIQVSQDLLRQFYWYDNALWIINKIVNYSMTTYDPCKCELVKVQDMDNYTEGQDY